MKYDYETMEEYENRTKKTININIFNLWLFLIIGSVSIVILIKKLDTTFLIFQGIFLSFVIGIEGIVTAIVLRKDIVIEKERQTKRK